MKNALLVLLAAAGVSACGSSPYGQHAAARDCDLLAEEIGAAEGLRRAAIQVQQDAWKAVIPVAIAGRLASGASALAASDRRLEALRGESARRGCGERHAG